MAIYRIDYESRSELEIKKLGGWRYAADPTTQLLLCAIARDDGPVELWDRYASDADNAKALNLIHDCSKGTGEVWAFNATGFEVPMSIHHWEKTFGCPMPALERWRCSAVLARVAAAPASLEKAAEFFRLPITKDKVGSSLIRIFSLKQKSRSKKEPGEFWITPEDIRLVTVDKQKIPVAEAWSSFREYCRRDVLTERELHKRVQSLELEGDMLEAFLTDMKMNARGVPINIPGVIAAEKFVEEEKKKLAVRFEEITGMSPNQTGKVLEWLRARGYPGKDLRKSTVSAVMQQDLDVDESEDDDEEEVNVEAREFDSFTMEPEAAEALKLRALMAYAALKKIPVMRKASWNGRVFGVLRFFGAHTGRASSTVLQLQNFKRGALGKNSKGEPITHEVYRAICEGSFDADSAEMVYGEPALSCVASSIRHWIDPGEGKQFLDVDLSNIESRCLAWLAQDDARLNHFRNKVDLYKVLATGLFNVKYDEVDDDQRQQAKVADLSLGYGGGKAAFQAMAGSYGLKLPVNVIKDLVKAYRKSNPAITKFWSSLQDVAIDAIKTPGRWFRAGLVELGVTRKLGYPELRIKLPSGRLLHYPAPDAHPVFKRKDQDRDEWVTIAEHRAKDASGDLLDGVWQTTQLTYYGQTKGVNYGRVSTWGGSLAENCLGGDTEVLTEEGWKLITEVGNLRVFDGVEFVSHCGLAHKGEKNVIDLDGLSITPDHLVLEGGEWAPAEHSKLNTAYETAARLYRSNIWRTYNRATAGEKQKAKMALAGQVHLRRRKNFRHLRLIQKQPVLFEAMSFFQQKCYQGQHDSWKDKSAGVLRLAEHAESLHTGHAQTVGALWWAGNHGMREVDAGISKFLGRHGPYLPKRLDIRSDRQRQRIQSGKLPVGYTSPECNESKGGAHGSDTLGSLERERGCGAHGHPPKHNPVSAVSGGYDIRAVGFSQTKRQKVYDIINCGPRNRFLVRGKKKIPLIVHNCCQAVAADFLNHGTKHLEAAGYKTLFQVHDQSVSEYEPDKGQSPEEVTRLMCTLPPWAPAFPLAAKAAFAPFYTK